MQQPKQYADAMDLFDVVEIFGIKGLYTNRRYRTSGLYCYDLRGQDDDPGLFASIEKLNVVVNHCGTIITRIPLDKHFGDNHFIEFTDENGPNFLGYQLTVNQFRGNEDKEWLIHYRDENTGQKSQACAYAPTLEDAKYKASQMIREDCIDSIEENASSEELIYRKVRRQHLIEDARKQVTYFIDHGHHIFEKYKDDDEAFEEMAKMFESMRHDDITDNMTWYNVLYAYAAKQDEATDILTDYFDKQNE